MFITLLVSAALPSVLALGPAEDAFDRALGDGAYAIAAIIRNTPPADVVIDEQAQGAIRSDSVDKVLFAVMSADGRLLAGDRALAGTVRPPGQPNPWVHTEAVIAEPLRVFSLIAPCGSARCEVRIAETLHKRDALRRGTLLAALVPECLLSLFMVLFVFFGVRRALAPLQSYTSSLLQVEESGWRVLDPGAAVQEVRPLILALNRAAERLRTAADSQQRFLSTAAHQLRTPLAGLKGAADLARLSRDPEQVRALLGQLSGSADRVARLASQLLALARSEPQVQNPEQRRPCDLAELAADLIEDAVRQAAAADIDLGFELAPAPLQGHPLLLRELVANLLDNAIRYTPPGGRVTVRTGTTTSAWVEVEDDGPGIPAELRESVLGRFVRLPGTAGDGSGLGLAIVKEICESHAAVLSLHDANPGATGSTPGLRIRAQFP